MWGSRMGRSLSGTAGEKRGCVKRFAGHYLSGRLCSVISVQSYPNSSPSSTMQIMVFPVLSSISFPLSS